MSLRESRDFPEKKLACKNPLQENKEELQKEGEAGRDRVPPGVRSRRLSMTRWYKGVICDHMN